MSVTSMPANFMSWEEFNAKTDTIIGRLNSADYQETLMLLDHARNLSQTAPESPEIESLASKIMNLSLLQSVTWPAATGSYYRARFSKDQDFERISDLWSPPSEITRTGRANLSGRPILYLASTPDTAIHEIGAENNTLVTMLEVTAQEPLTVVDLGCADRCFYDHDNLSNQLKLRAESLFYLHLNRNGWRNHHAVVEFLIEIFTRVSPNRAPREYILSAYLAAAILRRSSDSTVSPSDGEVSIDGLLYPSVSFLRNGHCLAVAPGAYAKLSVVRCLEYEVIDIEGCFPFCFLGLNRIGEVAGDRITWRPAHESGRLALQQFGPKMPRDAEHYVGVHQEGGKLYLYRKVRQG
jgi:hypothetical protein